jgi:hypothetical protein
VSTLTEKGEVLLRLGWAGTTRQGLLHEQLKPYKIINIINVYWM